LKRSGLYKFAHGARHEPAKRCASCIDSYHCSRYNTQTRRLTSADFQDVFRHPPRARRLTRRAEAGFDAREFLASLTEEPGVYRMLDGRRPGALRRQGEEPEEARRLLLPEDQPEPAHPPDGGQVAAWR
jgi:hypothetical protein